MSSFFKAFFCCTGRRQPKSPLLTGDSPPLTEQTWLLDSQQHPLYADTDINVATHQEATLLEEILRESEINMVNVNSLHPFQLRPPPPGASSESFLSRSSSSSASVSFIDDEADADAQGEPPRLPVLNVHLVHPPSQAASSEGERTPSPVAIKILNPGDQENISRLSKGINIALDEGFQIRHAAKLMQNWET